MVTEDMDAGRSAPKAKALILQTKGNSVRRNSIYSTQLQGLSVAVQWHTRALCISPFAKAVLCLSSSWSSFLTQFLVLMHLFRGAHYIHFNANLLEFPKRFELTLGWREAGKTTAPMRRPAHFNLICSSVLISNTIAHEERRV